MEFKKFRSTKDDIFISSPSGHTALLTTEFKSLPDVLWGTAYSQGAISEDMVLPKEALKEYVEEKKAEADEANKKDREEMKELLREVFNNPQGNVDKNGVIKYQVAVKTLKKAVKKDVIEELWKELAEEV